MAVLAGGAAGQRSDSEDDESALLVAEARRALGERDYDEAAALLDRALALNPRRLEAYILRASVHAVRKEFDRGVALMRRAQALAPDNPDVLTALGTQLMLSGRVAEGVPLLERVVERWPARYQAHALLGHHYGRVGEPARAIVALEAYLAARPTQLAGEDTVHLIVLGDAYLRAGQPARAAELFERVVGEDPRQVAARLGVVWAAAALDCRDALPRFTAIAELAEAHPELLLVWGRCALKVQRAQEALGLAGRFVERRPRIADGHALLGEARAALGDLPGARAALGQAVRLAPSRRIYVLRLAAIERRSGEPRAAAERLVGAGAPPPTDRLWRDWTIELAEALLADARPGEAAAAVGPVVARSADDALARTVLGAALAAGGDVNAALPHLEAAVALAPTDERARGLLIDSLNRAGMTAFRAGDLAGAEALLARAEPVGPSGRTRRNLGLVRLAAGRPGDALGPLELAARDGTDARALHLFGRALASLGRFDEARRALAQALTLTRGEPAVAAGVALELAATELEAGEPARAVATLEPWLTEGAGAARAARREAYLTAARAAATRLMLAGDFAEAVRVLERLEPLLAERPEAAVAVYCELALAATAAGQRDKALARLRKLPAAARCPFVAPADQLGAPILVALNEGVEPRRAKRSLDRLQLLRRQATGPAERLLRDAIRSIALPAAVDAYVHRKGALARTYLEMARKAESGRPSPDLAHNLAVLDLDEGRTDAAIEALERVADDVPEALVNLGIAHDRKGDGPRALQYFRRAAEHPKLRFAPVKEWIEVKERILGPGAGAGGQL